MIDKDFCLSSYMAFRYIWKEGVDFYEGMHHKNFMPVAKELRIPVVYATDIDLEITKQIADLYEKYDSIGILLSGGMDSAILASYLKPGSHAYTFVSHETNVFDKDEERAAYYCNKFRLKHHLIEITLDDYKKYTPIVMKNKCAPVHSIEPQIYKAAIQAKEDNVDILLVGESADLIFGGMDQLLSKDWLFEDFVNRYTFLDPRIVLANPVDMHELYEKYRHNQHIDFMSFMDDVFSVESSGSYMNAFHVAEMKYYDPYAILTMKLPLDLNRVRNGESKYLIRDLFALKYPELQIPNKIPMPRPVDRIFEQWEGPARDEFRKDIPMEQLTGNQKWQLWCAELFLNINDKEK